MADDVIGWEGLVLPYGEIAPVGDPRVVLPTTFELSRPLPLPVKVQWSSAPGHDNAEQGLALITRVWSDDKGLWASGPIDLVDERGAALARKISGGFLGFVSADIETDGGQVINTSEGRRPAFSKWRLAGVTLVGDPAFAAARIHAVTDPDRITPVADVQRAPVQEFAAPGIVTFASGSRRLTVTFAAGGHERSQEITAPFALAIDADNPPTPERSAMADEQEFAVAEPGLETVIDVDEPDRDDRLSDGDVQRIVDALITALDSRDMEAQTEFQRVAAARAALEEDTDVVL